MSVEGAIAEHARAVLPVTWDMLSKDRRFGDALLRQTVDAVKESVFGVVSEPSSEGQLPLTVINWVAKKVALALITPGIDLWQRTPLSVSATGTNENTTYSDPVVALRDLRRDLLEETRLGSAEVQPLINFRRVSGAPRPLMNTIDDELLTPSPQEFGRPYRVTDRS